MNLALTYASRSHHLRLARQINELIQQKYLEGSDSEDDEADDAHVGVGDWNSRGDEQESDYARERSSSLHKGLTGPQGRRAHHGVSSAVEGSKFNGYMEAVKRGKFIHKTTGSGGHAHSTGKLVFTAEPPKVDPLKRTTSEQRTSC